MLLDRKKRVLALGALLASVLALGGVPNANQIPSYPVRAQAFYPAGPTSGDEQVGPGRQTVATNESSAGQPPEVIIRYDLSWR